MPNTQRKPQSQPQAPRPRLPQPSAAELRAAREAMAAGNGAYTTMPTTETDEIDAELERAQRRHEVLLLVLDRQMEALAKAGPVRSDAAINAADVALNIADHCYGDDEDEEGDDEEDDADAAPPAAASA